MLCPLTWFDTVICLTEKLLVLLRDGRKLMGILRSFDQFGMYISPLHVLPVGNPVFCFYQLTGNKNCTCHVANAVLEGACERVIVGDLYCDIPLGLYVIRGENVVLIGELVSICKYFL